MKNNDKALLDKQFDKSIAAFDMRFWYITSKQNGSINLHT
jgi:hypothetical protein